MFGHPGDAEAALSSDSADSLGSNLKSQMNGVFVSGKPFSAVTSSGSCLVQEVSD